MQNKTVLVTSVSGNLGNAVLNQIIRKDYNIATYLREPVLKVNGLS